MSSFDDQLQRCLDPVPTAWPATALRHAAVLCPVVEEGAADHLVFAVRPANLRRHAGQIGFPGGMRDPGETPIATALRECHEEIGVAAPAIRILGALQPRESSSGILVTCLVARLQPVKLVLDEREVERALLMPLDELCQQARWTERPPPIRATGKQPRTSPHFRFGDDLLWGLTGRFVHDLVTRLSG